MYRQAGRQADRQTEHILSLRHRQTNGHKYRQIHRHRHKQTDTVRHRQIDTDR